MTTRSRRYCISITDYNDSIQNILIHTYPIINFIGTNIDKTDIYVQSNGLMYLKKLSKKMKSFGVNNISVYNNLSGKDIEIVYGNFVSSGRPRRSIRDFGNEELSHISYDDISCIFKGYDEHVATVTEKDPTIDPIEDVVINKVISSMFLIFIFKIMELIYKNYLNRNIRKNFIHSRGSWRRVSGEKWFVKVLLNYMVKIRYLCCKFSNHFSSYIRKFVNKFLEISPENIGFTNKHFRQSIFIMIS